MRLLQEGAIARALGGNGRKSQGNARGVSTGESGSVTHLNQLPKTRDLASHAATRLQDITPHTNLGIGASRHDKARIELAALAALFKLGRHHPAIVEDQQQARIVDRLHPGDLRKSKAIAHLAFDEPWPAGRIQIAIEQHRLHRHRCRSRTDADGDTLLDRNLFGRKRLQRIGSRGGFARSLDSPKCRKQQHQRCQNLRESLHCPGVVVPKIEPSLNPIGRGLASFPCHVP